MLVTRKAAVSSGSRVRPSYLNVLDCGIKSSIRVCYDYIIYAEINVFYQIYREI